MVFGEKTGLTWVPILVSFELNLVETSTQNTKKRNIGIEEESRLRKQNVSLLPLSQQPTQSTLMTFRNSPSNLSSRWTSHVPVTSTSFVATSTNIWLTCLRTFCFGASLRTPPFNYGTLIPWE